MSQRLDHLGMGESGLHHQHRCGCAAAATTAPAASRARPRPRRRGWPGRDGRSRQPRGRPASAAKPQAQPVPRLASCTSVEGRSLQQGRRPEVERLLGPRSAAPAEHPHSPGPKVTSSSATWPCLCTLFAGGCLNQAPSSPGPPAALGSSAGPEADPPTAWRRSRRRACRNLA